MKTPLKAIIIEDETIIAKMIAQMVSKNSTIISVVEKCATLEAGLEAITQHEPHIIFCDIQLGERKVHELLATLERGKYKIVVITAYNDYAIDMYDYKASAYLLKPINVVQLVRVLRDLEKDLNIEEPVAKKTAIEFITLPGTGGSIILHYSKICRIEASGNYSTVLCDNGDRHLISKPIGYFAEALAHLAFVRVHISYLINVHQVNRYIKGKQSQLEMKDKSIVPVSASGKELLRQYFDI